MLNGRQMLQVIDVVEAGNSQLIQPDALAYVASKGYLERSDITNGKRGRPVRNYVPVAGKVAGLRKLSATWKG